MAGYWRKRGKNSYRLEYTKDGDAHFKTIKVLGKNSREVEKVVEQELTKFILSIDSGSYINAPKKKFEKYAEDWLNLIQNDIAITTWENYERQLINHIIPYFAKKQIDKITAINVKQFYKHLLTNNVRLDGKKEPLSSRSVKDIHGILNKMFTNAKEWDFLEKT